MISHEMTRTMETALAEWVRRQAVPLVLAADTEDEAAVVIELLAALVEGFTSAPVSCCCCPHASEQSGRDGACQRSRARVPNGPDAPNR